MNFIDAVKATYEMPNKWMAIKDTDDEPLVFFKPTDYDGFYVCEPPRRKAPRWAPNADDVLSEKWVVVDFDDDTP